MTWGSHLGGAVTAFVDGELDAEDTARARRHLAGCDSCSAAVGDERRLRSLVAGADVPAPPCGFEAAILAVARSNRLPSTVVGPAGELVAHVGPAHRRLTPLAVGLGAALGLGLVASLATMTELPVLSSRGTTTALAGLPTITADNAGGEFDVGVQSRVGVLVAGPEREVSPLSAAPPGEPSLLVLHAGPAAVSEPGATQVDAEHVALADLVAATVGALDWFVAGTAMEAPPGTTE